MIRADRRRDDHAPRILDGTFFLWTLQRYKHDSREGETRRRGERANIQAAFIHKSAINEHRARSSVTSNSRTISRIAAKLANIDA
jgi:hypothetical protein